MGEQMDIDLQSMSSEELESFINSGGHQDEEATDQSNETEIVEDTNQEAEQEPEQEQEQEESEPDPEGQTEPDNDIPEFYRGKSAAELAKMLQDREKTISRQGQELGSIRNEIVSMRTTIDQKLDADKPQTKAEKKDFVDELVSEYGYDKKDVEVIAKLVEQKTNSILQQREIEQKRNDETRLAKVRQSNQDVWDTIRDIYPNAGELETAMIEEIRKDTDKTLNKPGWVKSFIKNYNTQSTDSEPKPTSTNGAKRRVMKTTTVKSGSARTGGNIPPREHLSSKSASEEQFRTAWNYYNPNDQI